MNALKPALAYFGLVFGAGFLLGAIRVPLLVPRLGERVAELIEAPIMLAVVVVAARFIVRRFALPPSPGPRWLTGLFALTFLLGAEMLLALLLQGRTPWQYITSRDPVSGSVYLLAVLLYAAMPWLLLRFEVTRQGATDHEDGSPRQ